MTCQDKPYLSSIQPYRSLKGYLSSGIRILPPGERRCHTASTSCAVPHLMWKDTDGLNLNNGPALIAMNGCPASSKDTRSQSPEGVPLSLVTVVILEPGNSETYHSASARWTSDPGLLAKSDPGRL